MHHWSHTIKKTTPTLNKYLRYNEDQPSKTINKEEKSWIGGANGKKREGHKMKEKIGGKRGKEGKRRKKGEKDGKEFTLAPKYLISKP
jgi:hypothetical protein